MQKNVFHKDQTVSLTFRSNKASLQKVREKLRSATQSKRKKNHLLAVVPQNSNQRKEEY